jgi:hypothetical protein
MNRMTTLVSGLEGAQEDWQAKAERLERCVCELLLKNQTLRMALDAERSRAEDGGHSHDLFADSPTRLDDLGSPL